MNTSTKLSAKTLMQLFVIAMITLTLFSCGGGGGGTTTTDDSTTPPTATQTVIPITPPTATQTVTTTIISATAATVSMLRALATGEPDEVNIYWSEVAGATSYKLYKSTTTLSNYQNASPTNLSMFASTVTFTTHTINASTITLSGTQTVYFLVTAINKNTDNEVESFTNATQTAATAFATPFLTVVSTSTNAASTTNRVWMDRNIGASRTATSSTDALAYGELYQWGRPADGHQVITSTAINTRVDSVTPTHGQFIYVGSGADDWTTVDIDGALRSAYWGRIDGSSICPTGFRVPTGSELRDERDSWSPASRDGAFASNLKWPAAGFRQYTDGELVYSNFFGGDIGYVWGMTNGNSVAAINIFDKSTYISFFNNISVSLFSSRSPGYSVRCIKAL